VAALVYGGALLLRHNGAADLERDVAVLLRRQGLPLGAQRPQRAVTCARVCDGGMTASTYPRSAAMYGFASVSSYSLISSAPRGRVVGRGQLAAVQDVDRALRAHHRDLAVGQAKFMSAPRCFEPITSYAPPYALRGDHR
jgi:hypothetical protein